MPPLDASALDTLFLAARTHNAFDTTPVDDATLRRVYELARMGPTAANSQPMRVVFVRSPEAKEKLRPCLAQGNVTKTMAAPVTAIVAYDLDFARHMPRLFPARPQFKEDFEGMGPLARDWMLLQNGSLQAAYLILAARAAGLDCGPMGGFDRAAVDAAFFPEGRWKAILLVNLGHGTGAGLPPRAPRFEFEDACRVV